MLPKQPAVVHGNRPIIADVNEGVQQQPGKGRLVSPHGTQPTVLSEGSVGMVIHL
jgi:hypothetical protein